MLKNIDTRSEVLTCEDSLSLSILPHFGPLQNHAGLLFLA